ncbi:hypothetical protein TNCT_219422 [Trichonephila clavata]|uniref:Uncharacterized protein n=1 Tax=Trichonephila clavata TaxID=2740835 RepID=A0A8X6GJ85_TRICU|nr:hypothetical protein TNCT_219422 [Trichonephila clavata]
MPSYNQYYPAGIFNFPPGNFAQLGTFNFTQPGSPASGQIIQNIVEYLKSTSPDGQASYPSPASSHLQSASPASSHLQSASPASSHLQPITPWTNFDENQFDGKYQNIMDCLLSK